jgi:8-oxo-dGTP pyrophosphatase MutT (NUDIX family)
VTGRNDFSGFLQDRFSQYVARRADPPEGTARAAVVLVLRAGEIQPEALFVVRATHERDPWSGHVALPGGREEQVDRDLMDTALRELHEETGLGLDRKEIVGRLDDLHPVSRHIPRIAISPFVAWRPRPGGVRRSVEIDRHFWVPVSELETPARRSSLTLRRDGETFRFPTIEYDGHTVWGLTYSIVQNFLELLGDAADRPAAGQ